MVVVVVDPNAECLQVLLIPHTLLVLRAFAGVDSYFTEIDIFHPFDCLRVRVDARV